MTTRDDEDDDKGENDNDGDDDDDKDDDDDNSHREYDALDCSRRTTMMTKMTLMTNARRTTRRLTKERR